MGSHGSLGSGGGSGSDGGTVQATVVCDYVPEKAGELFLRTGQTVVQITIGKQGWWYGFLQGSNEGGWFPKDFVERHTPPSGAPPTPMLNVSPDTFVSKWKAQAGVAQHRSGGSEPEQPRQTQMRVPGVDAAEQAGADDPAHFPGTLPAPTAVAQNGAEPFGLGKKWQQSAKEGTNQASVAPGSVLSVLRAHTPRSPQELTLYPRDEVTLLRIVDDTWCEVSLNGCSGLVPISCCDTSGPARGAGVGAAAAATTGSAPPLVKRLQRTANVTETCVLGPLPRGALPSPCPVHAPASSLGIVPCFSPHSFPLSPSLSLSLSLSRSLVCVRHTYTHTHTHTRSRPDMRVRVLRPVYSVL